MALGAWDIIFEWAYWGFCYVGLWKGYSAFTSQISTEDIFPFTDAEKLF